MTWQVTPYAILSFAVVLFLTTTAICTYRRRATQGANKTGALLLIASAIWILGAALEIGSFSLEAKIFWDQVKYAGILVVPTGWFIYILQCTGKGSWLTRKRVILLSALPLVFLLLILTNEYHELIWASATLIRSLPTVEITKIKAPFFWALVVHSYLMVSLGVWLLVRMLVRSRHTYRWQTNALLIAIFTPWLINLLDVLGIRFIAQADSTAFALAITAPAIVWGMWRVRRTDFAPVGRGTAIEGMNDAVIVLDGMNQIIELNSAATRLIGRMAPGLVGQCVDEVWPAGANLFGVSPVDIEVIREVVLHDGGEPRKYDMRISPLDSCHGRLASRVVVLRDISERKQAEVALAAERERLMVTLRSIGDGVVALDAEKRVVLANPVAEDHLKVLSGAGIGDVLTHLGDNSLETMLDPSSQGKNIYEVTLEGSPRRFFDVVAQQMESAPQIGGWVLVIRDVTSEKETQRRVQLQDRLAAVGQLAAGIAHDFNNILGAIILYTEMLLQMQGLSTKNRDRLATIYQQAERAATLTRQILDYSRRTVMDQAPMDLMSFLKDIKRLLSRTLPEGIQVKLECEDDNYVVNADPARIQQILMNLAFNARDAMLDGGELRFELSRLRIEPSELPPFRDMAPGAWLQLRVSDSGIGIAPDILLHIFEPFYTTKGPGEGSGLGLAQVYGIVKQHDGYIDVKSQLGVGTTFIIYLPAIEVPEWSSVTALANVLVDGKEELILVVEDDKATQIAVRDILETLNYQVLTAANGREALEIIGQHNGAIDLVLSDLVMPEMGGVELYQELMVREIGTKVVFMTGYPLGTGTRELLDEKGVTWLQKPLRSDTLARLIREVLDRQN
jgi:two-component system cell cycle sensor histidine kinase/response regulator CckA